MAPFTGERPFLNSYIQAHPSLVSVGQAEQKQVIVWQNIATFTYGHLAALYGLYLAITSAHWATLALAHVLLMLAAVGVTAHRLWAHHEYKARFPLQILLMVINTLAFQNSAITWVKDHCRHHKYRYVIICTVCFVLPTIIPVCFWGETLNTAWHIAVLRYVCNLHIIFLVNSVAHSRGNKPYDASLRAVQSFFVSFCAFGDGWQNYHYVFPWDYRTAEFENNRLNFTTLFIDFFAWLGWAYDLRTAPDDIVQSRAARTGDGTDMRGGRGLNENGIRRIRRL